MSSDKHKEMLPLITVGLPVFNGAKTIRVALESLVSQDYPNIEIIISDNASDDGTIDICKTFQRRDARIRLIQQLANMGPVPNFRAVLDEAQSEYFMWAAADDFWLPSFVSRMYEELQANPDAGVAMCAVKRVFEDGTQLDVVRFHGQLNPNKLGRRQLLKQILRGAKYNLFIYGLFRTDLIKRAMLHFPLVLGGDRQFICQLALATRFRYVDEVLHIRLHEPSHEMYYRHKMRNPRVWAAQIYSFVKLMLGSSVIPWRYKLLMPAAVANYAFFTFKQTPFGKRLAMFKTIQKRLYLSNTLAAILALILGSAALVSWLLIRSEIFSIGDGIVIFGLTFSSMILYLVNRKGLIAFQKAARISIVQLETVSDKLHKEIRYMTDMVIDSDSHPSKDPQNLLAVYACQRVQRHKKTVAFVRALEASQIRELYLQQLFPGIEEVEVAVGVINELSGHANKADMLYVSAITKHLGASKVFEFGTYMGRTTYHLARNDPAIEIYTLNLSPDEDLRYGRYLGVLFKGTEQEKQIHPIYSDSRGFDTTPYKGQFDLVFVDGDHSYEMVKNDTNKAFELLKPGGVIIWHDYAPKSDGLVKFFQEFTKNTPLFRIMSTCLLVYIDGVSVDKFIPGEMPCSLEQELRDRAPYLIESIYHS